MLAQALKREYATFFQVNQYQGMRIILYAFKKAYEDTEIELVNSNRGISFSSVCRYKGAQCDGPIQILDGMERDGLHMPVFLDSFKEDSSKVRNKVASKSKKCGWAIFALKWLMEMFLGYIPWVSGFTFIEYGGFPSPDDDTRRKIYSYLRCKELIVYMKANYGLNALDLLRKNSKKDS